MHIKCVLTVDDSWCIGVGGCVIHKPYTMLLMCVQNAIGCSYVSLSVSLSVWPGVLDCA